MALDVGVETAVAVRTQPDRFPELSVIESTARRYPNGALAPHLVGKVMPLSPESWRSIEDRGLDWTMATSVKKIGKRYRMDDVIGVSGIESACEDLLRGTRGYVTNWRAFKLLSVERVTREVAPEEGADVYLTLREDVQRAANEALAEAAGMADLEFTCGALAIVDVRDGSILAAASYPGYDLATFKDDYADLRDDPRHPLFFRARYGALPTGSVYKIITAIAALEEGAITPGTTFTCRHVETFAGRPFHCTSTYGHGPLSLVPAIEKSCNIYFYHTGLAVGGEALAKWGDWFGLNEPPGRVPVPRSTHGVVNLSIGQGGMQCTPIQVAAATAAVANGGRLYKTHFFHHAQKPDGEQVRAHEPSFKQVTVSRATLDTVREGMRRVVEGESGTARYAGLNPYRVAGKTGTAETGIEDQYHAWFAGYAPHDDPKIAFAVVSERTPGHGGSHTAPIMTLVLDRIWDEVEAMP